MIISRKLSIASVFLLCFISAMALPRVARAATITSVAVSKTTFNSGDTIFASFTTDGAFDSGNVFTLQVSNLAGSFAQPRSIGVLASSTGGTIGGKLPCDLTDGTGYRVRVVANSPAATGTDSSIILTVRPRVPISITPSGPTTFCEGDSVILSAQSGYRAYHWNTSDTTQNLLVRRSGIYTITATDSNECGLVASVKVTVQPIAMPQVTIDAQHHLVATAGFASYQWSLLVDPPSNWQPIPGATASTYVPSIGGTYRVLVTNADGCSRVSNEVSVAIGDGVEWERASDAGVKIYPRPAHDRLNVEMNLRQPEQVVLSLSDMAGREILRYNEGRVSGAYHREIPTKTLPSGVYLIQIWLGGRRLVEKTVVKSEG